MNARSRITLMIAGLAIALPQGPALAKGPNAKLWTGTFQLNLGKSKFTSPDIPQRATHGLIASPETGSQWGPKE